MKPYKVMFRIASVVPKYATISGSAGRYISVENGGMVVRITIRSTIAHAGRYFWGFISLYWITEYCYLRVRFFVRFFRQNPLR